MTTGMRATVVWWPAIGLLFLRNLMAAAVLGEPGVYASWIFGRACPQTYGMTCGAGWLVTGAFALSAVGFVVIVVRAAMR